MSLLDAFTPKIDPSPPFVRTRRVPSQPGSIAGKIYLGSDIGFVDYQGKKPRPGDLVHVTGSPGHYVATTGQALPSITQPTFSPGGCRCKCPAATGVIFYTSIPHESSPILAYDSETGTLLQVFGKTECWYPRSLAVDQQEPYTLYVLDDRRTLQIASNEEESDFHRDYFSLVRFQPSGGSYSYLSQTAIPDPFGELSDDDDQPNLAWPYEDLDPPDFLRNCLSVKEGVPLVTLYKPPARFLEIDGATITTRTLTLEGDSYNKSLRGPIVSIPDKPAKRNTFYVLACTATEVVEESVTTIVITEPELLQFNTAFEIIKRFDLSARFTYPVQLATVCNKLFILDSEHCVPTPSVEA